jgi:hypothetical protein
MFSDDEALAPALGLVAARTLGLASITPATASAQAKLERVMPQALQQRLRAVDTTVRLDLRPRDRREDGASAVSAPGLPHAAGRGQPPRLRLPWPGGDRWPLVHRGPLPSAPRHAQLPPGPRARRDAAAGQLRPACRL